MLSYWLLNHWTSDSKSNMLLSILSWHKLLIYSHALLILTKSSKSKHQVVHEQKFKDLLSNTCQVSVERSMLDLQSEAQWFNTHWGNILLLDFFVFT